MDKPFDDDDLYNKLFDSLLNIEREEKSATSVDDILNKFLTAANRYNQEQEEKRKAIEEAKKAADEAKRRREEARNQEKLKKEEKLRDAMAMVRTIDDFTEKWYPSGKGPVSEDSARLSAQMIIMYLDNNDKDDLFGGLF